MQDEFGNKIRYVDMCIYIDNNILKSDADVDKIYKYLVALSRMLAVKRRFFTTKSDYDNFAHYFAVIIYNRMTNKRQFLPQTDPKWLSPIKSCLNYMKQVIYGRKCAYCASEFSETDLISDSGCKEVDLSQFNLHSDLLSIDINVYFSSIDKLIKDIVSSSVYGNNTLLKHRLYLSVLISLLRNFTLSNKNKEKLIASRRVNRVLKDEYADVLNNVLVSESETAPINYNLDLIYKNYIKLLVQKIKIMMSEDIKSLVNDYNISDVDVDEILLLGSLSTPGGN